MALFLLLAILMHFSPVHAQVKQNGIDYFRCVNIYQQPAFRRHKLKLQMKLNIPQFPEFPEATFARRNVSSKNECPSGTVPIDANPSLRPLKDIHVGVKYSATISTFQGVRTYRGGAAFMGVFNPEVKEMQSSRANIWIQNGPKSHLNSIEVGWAVHPNLYGDNRTRLTAYWTVDNFQTTGCYNLLCPGFVQIDSSTFLGQAYPIDRVHPMMIEQIGIFQDNVTGNWWLVTQTDYLIAPVGYWPKKLFTYLTLGADIVTYGGTVSNYLESLDGPPMGSGKYPTKQGWQYGFFTRIRYVNDGYHLIDAEHSNMTMFLDSTCYDLIYFTAGGAMKEAMKFGGPGGSPDKCKRQGP